MAASMQIIPKERKKVCKKLNKLRETVLKKETIKTVDTPSKILCVCNGGLDNNVSHEEMLQLFKQYGSYCDVIMIPQKSYSFVCYTTIEESEEACLNVNGYKLPAAYHRKNEVVLYIFYVDEVPDSISPSKDKPPGLVLIHDAVSPEYAEEIMKSIEWEDTHNPAQQQQLKHRRVKHYGYEFKYDINNVDPDDPLPEGIPDVYKPLLDKLMDDGVIKHHPDQLTINQYQPGQGIPPHVDTPSAFEDGLISLSLGSQVLMEFRHPDGRHLSVLLPPRSALVMTGESRYIWSHGITPRKSDIVPVADGGLTLSQRGVRTSFTFRKLTGVRPSEEKDKPNIPCDDSTAAELEKLHVYQVYEEIADHFSGTRHTPWPNIAEFLRRQSPGSLLVDIGCGNGKYFGINKSLFEIGSDRSYNLAKIVEERNYQVYVGDILSVPLRAGVFDVCLCIAVIHHLATQERRKRAVSELLKILRPGGKALIYVWAMEQELNRVKSKYLKESKTCAMEENQIQCVEKTSENLDDSAENSEGSILYEKGKEISGKVTSEMAHSAIQQCGDDNFEKSPGTAEGGEYELTRLNEENTSEETETKNDVTNLSAENKKLEVHVNRTQFKQQDLLVPWQLKSKEKKAENADIYHRFYHVFRKGELEALCESISGCTVIKSYYDQGNWAVILEKL